MEIHEVLSELDSLFREKKTEQVEGFLHEKLKEAITEEDTACMITLLNELIGYYRDMSRYDRGVLYAERLVALMNDAGLTGTVYYATTLLNVANLYRAAGKLSESLECYETVCKIYDGELDRNDLKYASLYNNMSLLYEELAVQDVHWYDAAGEALKAALSIVSANPEYRIEEATTHANLAAVLMKQGKEEDAYREAQSALFIFEQDEEKDFHYSMALSAMADILYHKKDYEQAASFYEKALEEIDSNVGRSEGYYRVLSNLHQAYARAGKADCLKGLSLAREYYETYGRAMIHESFAEFEGKIAVGFVGEGSDCFGYDDLTSMDHDFGPAFCMWVTEETFEQIGSCLQEAYERLPKYLHGIRRDIRPMGQGRTGVIIISDFYHKYTGCPNGPESESDWIHTDECRLAASVNGEVFTDPEGIFTSIRQKILSYYPQNVWKRKMAQKLALMAQSGQYNYARLMGRGDAVSAQFARNQFVRETLEFLYLINRRYAPYYKWLFRGSENFEHLSGVIGQLIELQLLPVQTDAWEGRQGEWNFGVNQKDRAVALIEKIAESTVQTCRELNLTNIPDTYLETQAFTILKS